MKTVFKLGAMINRKEVQVVKKTVNGEECLRYIDLEEEKQSKTVLKQILNKNNCFDIFKNAIVDYDKDLRM